MSAAVPPVDLVLLDVDGTLLRGSSVTHATAVQASLQSVYGVDIALADRLSDVADLLLGAVTSAPAPAPAA